MISIVTPSLNQGRFIKDALKSVAKQDYPLVEHLVVDGESTDDTLRVLECDGGSRLRWISQSDRGQSDALNKGFAMAQGGLIGWLNADDAYCSPKVLSLVVRAFELRPEADIVYGDYALMTEQGVVFRVVPALRALSRRRLASYCPGQPSVFFRAKLVRANLLRTELSYGMDYEYWLRLAAQAQFTYIPRVLSVFRVSGGAKSVRDRQAAGEEIRAIRREYFGEAWYARRPVEPLVRRLTALSLRLCGAARLPGLVREELPFSGRFLSPGQFWWSQLTASTNVFVGQKQS